MTELLKHLNEAASSNDDGGLVSLSYPLELAVGNVLCDVLIGRRFYQRLTMNASNR